MKYKQLHLQRSFSDDYIFGTMLVIRVRQISKRLSDLKTKSYFPMKIFAHKSEIALSLSVYISLELGFPLCWFYYLAISGERT